MDGRQPDEANQAKTEVIFFAPKIKLSFFNNFVLNFGGATIHPSSEVKNLGAFFDNAMTMEKHVNARVQSAYFQIRNIWTIRKYLSKHTTRTSEVTPKLDYCNALLAESCQYLIKKLQRVQNAAARLVNKLKKRSRITPALKELHWLPIMYRIKFKVALTTYKAVNGAAPAYILSLLSGFRKTRNDNLKLMIPKFRLKRIGGRAFRNCAPMIWNSLPHHIRAAESTKAFKKLLKTFYFEKYFCQSQN